MTDKAQEDGNEIIAVFDGWVQDINVKDKPYWHPERNMTMYTYPDAFKYHSSWDALMPVVEKIEALQDNSIQFYIKDRRAYVERDTQASLADESLPDLPECYSGFCESKIEAVYSAVVQFIKWYNTNSK